MDLFTLLKTSLVMILMLSGPPLIAAIASGVLVSLLQTLVQVQDQTLPFSVKLVCVAIVLSMTGGWIGSELLGLTNTVFVTIQRGSF